VLNLTHDQSGVQAVSLHGRPAKDIQLQLNPSPLMRVRSSRLASIPQTIQNHAYRRTSQRDFIVEMIKLFDSPKDLATICLCSKRFSSITLPILCSSPKLTGAISIQQFLVTILDKLERVCLVKSFDTRMKLLSIREETYMTDDAYCEMPALYITTACRAKALSILQEVFPSQSEATTWLRDCFDPLCWDTVVPLLSLVLPNLEMFKTHTFVGQNLYAVNNFADEKSFWGMLLLWLR
jgi:hypothetical protein